MSSYKSTPRKRFFKLAGMSASVATKYTSTKIKNRFGSDEKEQDRLVEMYQKVGAELVSTLGELKGAAMKIGQVLSQMEHLFPEELSAELRKLQNKAPPMAYEVISSQIVSEFGFPPEKLFASFDKTPFAAASIGQVHRAKTWEGDEIVVKIQYPGVDLSCESDMKHLRRILKLSGLLKVDQQAMDEVFDEIQTMLFKELDYKQEKQWLDYFNEYYEEDDKVVIPKALQKYSSKRVLSLTFEPGDSLETLRSDQYTSESRLEIAHRLFSTIAEQIFHFKLLHSDPHPGNFAFRKDGSLIIYDFGCVSQIPEYIVEIYAELLKSILDRDYEALDGHFESLGMRSDEHKVLPSFYQTWIELAEGVLENCDDKDRFSNFQSEVKEQRSLIFDHWGAFKPCADTVFVNRVLGGQLMMLEQMGYQKTLDQLLEGLLEYC